MTSVELLGTRVEATPDAEFLIYGDQRLTYAEVWAKALQFAAAVRRLGPSSRVATYLANCPWAVQAMFGTHAAGGVHVAINRQHRGAILHDMLCRSEASILVTDSDALAEIVLDGCGVQTVVTVDSPESTSPRRPGPQQVPISEFVGTEICSPAPVTPLEPASVLFTSGTTGRSKAVLLPHTMLTRGARHVAEASQLTSDDSLHLWAPLYHIAGQLDLMLPMVVAGGVVVLVPRFSLSNFWKDVEDNHCPVFFGFPGMLQLLAKTMPTQPTSLRVGVVGGISPGLRYQFEEKLGVRFIDAYGMTEAEPIALSGLDSGAPPGSCGRPTSDWSISVFDNDGFPQPAGVPGEIVARPRRPGVMMLRYEHDEAATVTAFRGLWWHTGDRGYVDSDGYLFVTGRLNDTIRRRGENISPRELEGIICQHPGVTACVALGVEDAELPDQEVKIIVVPALRCQLTAESLHDWCRGRMSSFMLPRFIEIRDQLPLTGNGKLQLTELRANGSDTWDSEEGQRET